MKPIYWRASFWPTASFLQAHPTSNIQHPTLATPCCSKQHSEVVAHGWRPSWDDFPSRRKSELLGDEFVDMDHFVSDWHQQARTYEHTYPSRKEEIYFPQESVYRCVYIYIYIYIYGQWSMPVRHKASPFWAQAVKRKMYIGFACNFKFLSHLAKSVEVFEKVHSSDDGISLLLAMVPNLCIDKKLGFDSPRIHLYLYILHICVHAHFLEIPSHKSHGGDWWPRHLIDSVPGWSERGTALGWQKLLVNFQQTQIQQACLNTLPVKRILYRMLDIAMLYCWRGIFDPVVEVILTIGAWTLNMTQWYQMCAPFRLALQFRVILSSFCTICNMYMDMSTKIYIYISADPSLLWGGARLESCCRRLF